MNNDPANRPGPGNPSSINSLRVLMELYRVNEKYIQEVVDASRKILQTVLESLVPGDHLKHCPVRTFFRILSGMIFILKARNPHTKKREPRTNQCADIHPRSNRR